MMMMLMMVLTASSKGEPWPAQGVETHPQDTQHTGHEGSAKIGANTRRDLSGVVLNRGSYEPITEDGSIRSGSGDTEHFSAFVKLNLTSRCRLGRKMIDAACHPERRHQ
ncbi:cytoplasm protein [Anopheles sinensis]|uniref:Cytoplasm protein n=1 Tax=Anopheles sinensis TaxID=74873 RepID=A0A084VDV2_ANOSI|nr:cytoplasm protein [Anopheles sinensis]